MFWIDAPLVVGYAVGARAIHAPRRLFGHGGRRIRGRRESDDPVFIGAPEPPSPVGGNEVYDGVNVGDGPLRRRNSSSDRAVW